ncbi:hypothetical protein N7454_001592 [Penicillium verhagenii]|nr:hypothetical protein N7454_001592 [Penicillium verhagenii]
MQQFWRIIAPGRREVTGCLGELVEVILSGSAANIVPLLAVPLNTHRHENLEVDPGENIEDEEEEECTKRRHTNDLPQSHWSKAARIDRHDNETMILRSLDRANRSQASLESLPSKLHNLVFGSLDDMDDILSFSLTSRYFWAVGLTHIEDRIFSASAPWAGERIICVSDHSKPQDFPAGLLSAKEQDDLEQLNRLHHLDTFTVKHPWKKIGGQSLSERLRERFEKWEAANPMSQADRTEILMGLKPELLEFYPRDQPWVLRNLTTKDYVLGEAIALKESFVHGPQIDVLGFAEVLISRIAWSNWPIDVGHGRNISHGKWAGHRFDIVPLTCVHKSSGQGWTDVSNELLREMDLLLTIHKGDDWRDNLSRRCQKITPSVALGYCG